MEFNQQFSEMQNFFNSGTTRSENFVRSALTRLRKAIQSKENELIEALHLDLGKHPVEIYTSEILVVYSEIASALKNIHRWRKISRKKTPLAFWPGRSYVAPQPKGVVLIIGPWNYPFQLTFAPLVGALAAGCCAFVKPSEFTTRTSAVIQKIINENFDPQHCLVVQGDALEAKRLCSLSWDHIFFTGSTRVGRLVMESAAQTLTPVTLELGGKSPCIVLDDVPLRAAAERIVWGKYLNAGQTCIAPDTLYVHTEIADRLTNEIVDTINRFFGSNPAQSPDYGRIVNTQHLRRLESYLKDVTIVTGGDVRAQDLYIAPTVVCNIPSDSALHSEEIFGPILPIIPFSDVEVLIHSLKRRPTPLALYLFTRNTAHRNRLLSALPSGSVCINDTIKQAASPELPFGGIRESGIGNYHGKASFDCFTHYRSVFETGFWGFRFHFPPYKVNLEILKKAARFFT